MKISRTTSIARFLSLCLAIGSTLAAGAGTYRPGLWQGKANQNDQWTVPLESSAIEVERVPGAVMADIQADESNYHTEGHTYSNAVTGTTYNWNRADTTFWYIGEVYLEAGKTYVFSKRLDDGARVTIDGNILFHQTEWDKFAYGTFTPEATGWYPIDIRIADGTGGKGPQSSGIGGTGLGLAYRDDGVTTENTANWKKLIDPGDLSFFRVMTDESLHVIQGASLNDGICSVTVAVPAGPGTARVYLNEAASDPIRDPAELASWDASSALVDIPAGEAVTLSVPWPHSSAPYILVHATGTDDLGGFETFTDPITLDALRVDFIRPLFSSDLSQAALEARIVYAPTPVTADFTYRLASSTRTTRLPAQTNLTSGDLLSFALPNVEWGSTYVYSLTLTGDAPTTFTGTFRTPVEPTVEGPGLWQGRAFCVDLNPMTDTTRIADLDANACDRTLGMLMARPSSDSKTSGCADPLTTRAWGWDAEKGLNFVYEGAIWLEKDTPIYVISKFDDGGAAYINNELIFSQWIENGNGSGVNDKGNYHAGDYTPTYTGWHDFRGYIWDWGSDKKRAWGVAGVQWTMDTSAVTFNPSKNKYYANSNTVNDPAIWHEFYDDGTGSFLALSSRSILVGRSSIEGNTIISQLAIPAIGPCTLYAWSGATYGGADADAWDATSAPLGTFSGDGSETTTIYLPISADAQFIRYYAIPTSGASPSLSDTQRRDTLPQITAAPEIVIDTTTNITLDSATLSFSVLSAGVGSDTCEASVVYGYAPEALTSTQFAAASLSAGDAATVTLTNLVPARQYYAAIYAVAAEGEASLSAVVNFCTSDLPDNGLSTISATPGLYQSFATKYKDQTDPFTDPNADILPGAVMVSAGNRADQTPFSSYTAPSGITYYATQNSTYSYAGYMYMEGGKTYTFGANYDDWKFLSINGQTLINSDIWDARVYGSFTPPATDWYPILIRVGDTGGDIGMNTGSFLVDRLGAGMAFSTDYTVLNTNNYFEWHPLTNTVDTIYFRISRPLRVLDVDSFSVDNGALTATLATEEDTAASTLYVCYGPTYCDTNITAWATTKAIGTLDANATSFISEGDVTGLYETARFVRFYVSTPTGLSWSKTLIFADATVPMFASNTEATGLTRGDHVTLSSFLESTGGSDCTITLAVSLFSDLSDAFTWTVGTATEQGPISFEVFTNDTTSAAYIRPGTPYYYQFKATNQSGSIGTTPIHSFTTDDGVKLGSTSAANSLFTLTINGSIVNFGANETTLTLYVGPDADSMVPVATKVLPTPVSDYSIAYEVPALGQAYTYAVLASNACDTVSWTHWSPTITYTNIDNADYYWRADIHSGAWNDAANWDTTPSDPRLTYPNSASARVFFSRCTPEAPYTVTVPASYTVNILNLHAPNADITFLGNGAETSRIHSTRSYDNDNEGFGVDNGTRVTLDGLYFSSPDCFRVRDRSELHLLHASTFQVDREIWMNGTDSRLQAYQDSLIHVRGWDFQLNGNGGQVLLDDSTLRVSSSVASIAREAGSTNNIVEFYGTHPRLIAQNVLVANGGSATETNVSSPTFRFHVPAEGYDEAPIQRQGTSSTVQSTDKVDLHIEIAKDSGWFQTSKTGNIPLIAWKYGILASRINTDNQPCPDLTSFFWTYGQDPLNDPTATTPDGANPTGLWANLKGAAATILLFR